MRHQHRTGRRDREGGSGMGGSRPEFVAGQPKLCRLRTASPAC